jgi:hypothetical protein
MASGARKSRGVTACVGPGCGAGAGDGARVGGGAVVAGWGGDEVVACSGGVVVDGTDPVAIGRRTEPSVADPEVAEASVPSLRWSAAQPTTAGNRPRVRPTAANRRQRVRCVFMVVEAYRSTPGGQSRALRRQWGEGVALAARASRQVDA